MTNREWIDLLSKEFDVSEKCAENMLRKLKAMKLDEEFRKMFIYPYREDGK